MNNLNEMAVWLESELALVNEDFSPFRMFTHGIHNHAAAGKSDELDAYQSATMDLSRRMMKDPSVQKALKHLQLLTKKAQIAKTTNNAGLLHSMNQKRARLLKALNKHTLNNMSDKEKELAYDKNENLRQLDKNAVPYKTPQDIERVLGSYIQNPATGNSILVKTALHYGPSHPAYATARALINQFIGEPNEQSA